MLCLHKLNVTENESKPFMTFITIYIFGNELVVASTCYDYIKNMTSQWKF